MSRSTIFSTEPSKYFQGEDLPQKPKHATHLVTYPNFLVSDFDHSLDRPFTSSQLKNSRKFVTTVDFHLNRENLPNGFDQKPVGKKRTECSDNPYKSTFDPIKFDSSQCESPSKTLRKRVPLKQTSQTDAQEMYKPSKKINHLKVRDSSGVKDSLRYH